MVNTEVARTTIKTEYFGSLTERMNKYREDVLNKKPYIDAERAVLATRAYDRYKEQPNVLKRAYMLKEILENMTIKEGISNRAPNKIGLKVRFFNFF